MRSLKIQPQPGTKGRAHEVSSYDFPENMNEGDEIIVLSVDEAYCNVRDANGCERRLFGGCVDCGARYEVAPKVWVSEDDPRVLDYIENTMHKTLARYGTNEPMQWAFDETVASCRRHLARYGR